MVVPVARFALAATFVLGACTPDSGGPDMTRGSADSPMTMLVDQTQNGASTASGTMVMSGAAANPLSPSWVAATQRTGANFGGAMRSIEAAGGQKR